VLLFFHHPGTVLQSANCGIVLQIECPGRLKILQIYDKNQTIENQIKLIISMSNAIERTLKLSVSIICQIFVGEPDKFMVRFVGNDDLAKPFRQFPDKFVKLFVGFPISGTL
jgi:hypothetical protein